MDTFLADLVIENPEADRRQAKEGQLVLSTVHSAKGLEWSAVLLIDLVDERFPSRHALAKPEDLEEERRLLYVACTRARDYLGLFAPETLYQRQTGGCAPALPSIFLRELPPGVLAERRERLGGRTSGSFAAACPPPAPAEAAQPRATASTRAAAQSAMRSKHSTTKVRAQDSATGRRSASKSR